MQRAREPGPRRRIVTNEAVAGNIHLKPDLYDHYRRAMSAAPPGILPVIAVDRGASKPLYRQLYEGYRDAIVERRLRPGQRLPSTRSLAIELEISRIPVLNAFEQLLAEGYFESRTGSGTFVASALPGENLAPARARRAAVRAAPARPAPRKIGRMAAELRRLEAGPWFRGRGAFSVGEPALDQFPLPRLVEPRRPPRPASGPGAASLRRSDGPGGASRGGRRVPAHGARGALRARPDHDRERLAAGARARRARAARPGKPGLDRGARLLRRARASCRLAGARLVPVPVDDEGLDVAAGIARSPRPRAVYVTPSHQYPLGVTMSAARRLQLLDWARRERLLDRRGRLRQRVPLRATCRSRRCRASTATRA